MEAQLVEKQAVAATVNIKIDATDVDRAFEEVLTRLSRQMKVPGFRPGRAPKGVIERRVGAEALGEEVREALVEDAYPRAMQELDLMPVDAHFHADNPVRGEEFEIVVHAELYPEVTLPDTAAIEIEAKIEDVTDEEVAEFIDGLRRDNATLVPVDRPIEETDWVLLKNLPDDDASDEEAGEDSEGDSTFPVDLERAGEELRTQLLGKNIGERVDVKLTDTAVDDEEGNPVIHTVKVRVMDVKGKELPELGDDLAKHVGFETAAELEEQARAILTSEKRRDGHRAQYDELIEKLVGGATLELPPSLIIRRKRSLLHDLAHDLSHEGVSFDDYLKRLDERGTREEFDEELEESAQRGVRRDLVLEQLLEERGTELSNDEFMEAAKQLAQQRGEDLGRMFTELGAEWQDNYRFLLRRDKAVRELLAELTGLSQPAPDEDDLEDAADAAVEAVVAEDGNDEE